MLQNYWSRHISGMWLYFFYFSDDNIEYMYNEAMSLFFLSLVVVKKLQGNVFLYSQCCILFFIYCLIDLKYISW